MSASIEPRHVGRYVMTAYFCPGALDGMPEAIDITLVSRKGMSRIAAFKAQVIEKAFEQRIVSGRVEISLQDAAPRVR